MKIHDFLKIAVPTTDIYDAYKLYDEFAVQNGRCDLEYSKLSEHKDEILSRIKAYTLYEFSVDDHSGFYTVYTFDDVLFARSESSHEDQVDIVILDVNGCDSFIEYMKRFKKDEPARNKDDEIIEIDFPILQMFDSAFNIMGSNLLFVEEDGNFTKIENYWQDRNEMIKDKGRTYAASYRYNKYEIVTAGVQRRVHYRNIVGVIGDSKEIADSLLTRNFNEPEFKHLWKGLSIIELGE